MINPIFTKGNPAIQDKLLLHRRLLHSETIFPSIKETKNYVKHKLGYACIKAGLITTIGMLENPKLDAAAMIHVSEGIPLPCGTVIFGENVLSIGTAVLTSIAYSRLEI